MDTKSMIEQIGALRRYAAFLIGNQDRGDALVTAVLEEILAEDIPFRPDRGLRVALFRALHDVWVPRPAPWPAGLPARDKHAMRGGNAVSPLERAVLILMRLEGFCVSEVGYILRMEDRHILRRLERAENTLTSPLTRGILIVEDNFLAASELLQLVASLGYRTLGPAATGDDAIRLARQEMPALILSDIHLGEGRSGIEAIRQIRDDMDVPVIYVTGFPQRLRERPLDPASYVVPKPFSDRLMKSFIAKALLHHRLSI
jgi:CheY-like chemotaxis protein